jgi:lysophospholipase L1-like esterase
MTDLMDSSRRRNLDQPSQTLTLLYMGDSITYGQHLDPSLRWTSLVDARIRESFTDIALLSFNSGVSGDTSRMALERFPSDAQDLAPAVATLQFGLNDCNCWKTDRGLPRVSERAFVANLIEMVTRLRQFATSEIILATNHRTLRRTTLPSGHVYEDANGRYSELIREAAFEAEATLCDVREAFLPFDDRELAELLLPYPDQLHLSAQGNSVYADAIWPFVLRAFETALSNELAV